MALGRQPVQAGRDPERGPGRVDPPGLAPDPRARSASRSSATGRSTSSAGAGRDDRPGTAQRPARRWARGGARRAPRRPSSPSMPGTRPATSRSAANRLVFCAVGGPAFVTDLDRGRRPGNFADFGRLRPGHRRPEHPPPGGRRPARADRPAGRDPPPRHVPRPGRPPRQDVALPGLRRGPSSTTRSRSRASRAGSIATSWPVEPSLITIINTNSPLRLDGPMSRRADRDGDPRPGGRRDAVHAGRGDEPVVAGRGDRPAERGGAVRRRPGPGRPARGAGRLRRVHLERRHAHRLAGVRDAGVRQGRASPPASSPAATGCRGDRRT